MFIWCPLDLRLWCCHVAKWTCLGSVFQTTQKTEIPYLYVLGGTCQECFCRYPGDGQLESLWIHWCDRFKEHYIAVKITDTDQIYYVYIFLISSQTGTLFSICYWSGRHRQRCYTFGVCVCACWTVHACVLHVQCARIGEKDRERMRERCWILRNTCNSLSVAFLCLVCVSLVVARDRRSENPRPPVLNLISRRRHVVF